ncbi:putative ankyrin repeat protein RF_0381 [Zophobas morio]|uniref:putative ankyrin repeat protein RF_0381 n=1 Tax=Zophobas morio TaxID=2755281 RepID=UPI003083B624
MNLYRTIMNDAFDYELQDMWQVLTENGAKFGNGGTILHKLLDDEDDIEANEEFIIYLLDNWNVNSKYFYLDLENTILLGEVGFDADRQGITALQIACYEGDFEMAESLMKVGAKAKVVDNDGNTALHYASVSDEDTEEIIPLLIIDGVDNQYGITPLHIACECSEPYVAALLTHFGANASVLDSNKNNVLHYLMRSEGDEEELHMVLVVFLDLNIFDINTQNIYGTTALHLACQYCHYKLVKVLLLEEAKVDILDNDNNSALHYASYSNKSSEKLIRRLLRRGLNINEPNKNGVSPLHLACNCGNLETAQILLAKGANINDVDYNELDALHYASSSTDTNTNLITLLLDKGLNVNCVNKYGASPLHFARKSDNIDVLLEAGAQLQSLDNNNNNILHYVSRTTDEVIELLNYLLSAADFNVNAQNNCGTTPLQLACKSGNFLFVKELYEHGAELNILDNDKKSALHYALESSEQNNSFINYLIYNGIDVNVQDDHGKTPLELACSTNNYQVVETLIEFGAGAEMS